jgi:hypothetical protein
MWLFKNVLQGGRALLPRLCSFHRMLQDKRLLQIFRLAWLLPAISLQARVGNTG